MPKLNFIHICEKAFFSKENGNLTLIEIFENILSEKFPASHTFSVVISIDTVETGTEPHTGELIFKKDGKQFEQQTDRFDTGKEGRKSRYRWIHNFENFIFLEEGKYTIEVHFDREFLGSTEINLLKK